MKKSLLVIGLMILFSCSDDNDIEDNELNGEWTLTNVSCFCGFPDPTDFHLTQLVFNITENEVEVINKGVSTYFMQNGTYSYSGSGNRVSFEDGRSYDFEFTNGNLQLIFVDEPNIADDEVTYTFTR